jgi:hypothetical protein
MACEGPRSLPCFWVGAGVSHVDDHLPLAVLLLLPDRGVLAVVGNEVALFIFGGVDVIAVGVAEIAGRRHFSVDGRPGKGRAFGPRGLFAHRIFVVDATAVNNFDAIFGKVGEESVVAVLCDIGGETGLELEQEVGTVGGFFIPGKGSRGEKEQKENGDDDSVHRNLSGRSGGGFGHVRR